MATQDEIRAKDIVPHKTSFSAGDGFYGDGDSSFFMKADDLMRVASDKFFYNDKVNSYIKELYVVSARAPKYVQLTQGATVLWLRVLDENLTMIAQFDTAYNGVVKWTQKAADTTDAWAVLTDVVDFGIPWGETSPEIIRSCEIMNCPIIKAHFMDEGVLDDAKDYTDEQIAEVEEEIGDIYTTVYTNLEPTMTPALSMLTFKPILDGDHYNYVMDSSGYSESGSYVYLGFKITEVWKKNHSYFIAIDLEVVTDSKTTGGNFYGKLRAKGKSSSYSVSNEVTPVAGVVNGTRGNLKGFFTINDNIDTYPNADNFILQAGKYTSTESLELNIYNVCVIDMGIEGQEGYKSYEEVDALFNLYGYTDVAKMIANCNHAIKADVAKTVESMAVGGDIDLWGDSLVAQNYGAIVGAILGRTVNSHGFGGKKSAYIRDQFLAYTNKNNTIVINVGRNDTGAGNADIVFQNIAAMVAAIPHQRFLICCPPNGNYANEGKGGTTYKFFEDLEERLAKAYPANFLNSRENTIFAYDMGDVKLTASFTKPNLNGSVTISVSDAAFLTTYNAADVARWGETNAKKVAIGHTIDACDIYAVTAHDDVNNTLTLTLLESNSDVASGNTFENFTNDGSVNYARVLQYFDYTCWNDDRTQSTFRSDGIHMSAYGKECIAKALARKIYEMHI